MVGAQHYFGVSTHPALFGVTRGHYVDDMDSLSKDEMKEFMQGVCDWVERDSRVKVKRCKFRVIDGVLTRIEY